MNGATALMVDNLILRDETHASKPTKPKLTPHKQPNGRVMFNDDSGNAVYSYEQGEIGVSLPSGRKTNILYDSRLVGQAQYSPICGGFAFSPEAIKIPRRPDDNPLALWEDSERMTDYIFEHEYIHFVWDQLSPEEKERTINLFSRAEILPYTRSFGAVLIANKEYATEEMQDLTIDCFEFQYGGSIHRFPKEFIISELLAHVVIGKMMHREGLDNIQVRNRERKNFVDRSKTAIDCLARVEKLPEEITFLRQKGLVDNKDFVKDYPVLKQTALGLA